MKEKDWTHPICLVCWVAKHDEPVRLRLKSTLRERCCWCGADTRARLYERHNPDALRCKGVHLSMRELAS